MAELQDQRELLYWRGRRRRGSTRAEIISCVGAVAAGELLQEP